MLKVAVLGFGTVGSGVVETLDINAESIKRKTGCDIQVKYIVDVRDFPDCSYADLMVKDFSIVENDPEVSIVVETIGGIGVAYEFTKRSLAAGKSVVTSNKELVATYGSQLMQLAEENGVSYMFEASVAGGVPLLRPLMSCLTADYITEVCGILNGTTNYILTEMFKYGGTFEEALSKAKELGYSEANPAADIEGLDACRKVCIISSLITGMHVAQDKVSCEGITKVDVCDVENAGKMGYTIKLLGRIVTTEDGGITAYVAPHFVNTGSILADVEGVMNGIVVRGNIVGEVMFYGPGAGKMPTASAVAADVIAIAQDKRAGKLTSWQSACDDIISDSGELKCRWYVRANKIIDAANAKYIESKDGWYTYTFDAISAIDLDKLTADAEVVAKYRIID